jgi:hypothetical protein
MDESGFKISQLDDVQNRASYQAARDSIRIQIHADIDGVPLNDGHVAISDVVMTAVAHVDAEWLEGVRRDQVSHLFRRNHLGENL